MFHVEHLACFFQCHSPVYSLGTAPLCLERGLRQFVRSMYPMIRWQQVAG